MSFLITNTIRQTLLNRFVCPSKSIGVPLLRYSNTTKEGDEIPSDSEDNERLGGFAKAYRRQTEALRPEPTPAVENQTFASLLKNSKFIDVSHEH